MTVQHILEDKGSDIVSVSAGDKLAAVTAILAQKRIGAVLVMEGERISGILSERDIVRALAERGADAMECPVSERMTREVETCEPRETIESVMRRMTDGRFRHLPVLESGRLVGVVSIGDVVKRRIAEIEREADQLREYIAS